MQFEEVLRGIYLEGLCADRDSAWVSDPIKGGVRRWRRDGSVASWLPEKRWIGGLLLNTDEVLLVTGEGGILWLDSHNGASGMLLEAVDGKPLPGVNEMAIDSKGGMYFGSLDVPSIAKGKKTAPVGIHYLSADGKVAEVFPGLRFSNGVAISPDGKRLYHNETFVGTSAYDIAPDGSLSNPVFLLDKPDCDGIAVDAEGTVWITGCKSSAITCLRPDGSLKELVQVPGGGVTCVRFGGEDLRDVYFTSVAAGTAEQLAAGIWPEKEESVLYRARSEVPGLATPRPAFPIPRS